MPEQTYTSKLREAEFLASQGAILTIVLKKIGVTDCTCYRRRKEYGGMRVGQAKRLKEVEKGDIQLSLYSRSPAESSLCALSDR